MLMCLKKLKKRSILLFAFQTKRKTISILFRAMTTVIPLKIDDNYSIAFANLFEVEIDYSD